MPKLPDITLPGKLASSPLKDGWLEDDNLQDLGQGRFAVSFRGGYVVFVEIKNTLGGIFSLACFFVLR